MTFSHTGVAASTLEELLSYHDERFIHSAYQTLLGRAPDSEGMRYYLARVRAGISKVEIFTQLHLSAEGKSRQVEIAGLNEAIRRQKWLKTPLLGALLRLAGVNQVREASLKNLRAIENKLHAIDVQMRQRLVNIEISLANLQKNVTTQAKNNSLNTIQMNNVMDYLANLQNEVAIQTQNNSLNTIQMNNVMDYLANLQNEVAIQAQNNSLSSIQMNSVIDYLPEGEEKEVETDSVRLNDHHASMEDGKDDSLQDERIRHSDYIQIIKNSNLFDADFYLSNYSIDQVFQNEPILHYILFGETEGLQPNSGFWPKNYLKFNTDVADAGIKPFSHFLQIGMREGRTSLPLPPIEGGLKFTAIPSLRGRAFANPQRVAICLHIYYDDLWDEFELILNRLTHSFDLFVSIIDRGYSLESIKEKINLGYPDARVFVFPNHGRDIFPFVSMAAAGLFDSYDAVCKMHTKKSPHREDGEDWRNHLVNGVIPTQQTDNLVEEFLSDDEFGILVADGQIFEGNQWWGSNKNRVPELLHRVEIQHSMDRLRFPAGSIYWVKKSIVNLIRGMQLTVEDFEIEDSQLDGTTAHAFERTLGYLTESANLKVVQTSDVLSQISSSRRKSADNNRNKPFVSAFYLPQFHSIPENNAWWGVGYTEWVGSAKAKPQYSGHYQPITPVGTGFYDLRLPEVIGEQFKLAKSHGIDAFCIYYYWFDNGRRLLEAPVDNLLARPDIDACFYLCWANESWTRNWDGLSGEVLMSQTYQPGFENDIAKDSAKYFSDSRYYRFNGVEPRFVIYRPEDIPDLPGFIERLHNAWKILGFTKVNLGAVLFHLNSEAGENIANLFDFFIEMPPHGLVGADGWIVNKDASNHDVNFPVNKNFKGLIYSYDKLIEKSLAREFPDFVTKKVIRGVMPSWDNTARRGNNAHICYGANPARFGVWIDGLLKLNANSGELMINSWNEWGEKAMIEPSCQYGSGYLAALKNCLKN
ncbi:glycoside hydrolase family 99-like domain-containing protein [Polaromonas sp. DSR2-3-2]|uniref:glycoside hydrolase family 99-like domain-containing protein n=1 Tax=unclassified Polaromonas TaxID=2638319 RepID=UPI003CE8843F